MTTVSTLNIAYQSFGAQAALDTLKSVSGAIGAAAKLTSDAYSQNEQLGMSLTALAAKELVRTGQYHDLASAQGAAAAQAQQLLGWNQKLAIQSPFGADQISGALKLLNAFGFLSTSGDKLSLTSTRITKDLVDLAAATGTSGSEIQRMALTLGQVNSLGRLQADNANELANRYVNIRDILANKLGVSLTEVNKRMTAGLIDSDFAIRTLLESLERDYGGAAAKQGGTLAGVLNSLQDLGTISLRTVASPSIDVLKAQLNEIAAALQTDAVNQELDSIGATIGGVVRTTVTGVREMVPYISYLRDAAPIIAGAAGGYALYSGVGAGISAIKTLIGNYQAVANEYLMTNGQLAGYIAKNTAFIAGQAFAIGAIGIAWRDVSQAYDDYQAKLQKGAHQVTGGEERDKDLAKLLNRIRRADAGITDNPQAVAVDDQKQTVEQKIAAYRELQAKYDESVANAADALARAKIVPNSNHDSTANRERRAQLLRDTRLEVQEARRNLDAALADANAAQDKREALERLMNSAASPSKSTSPYAPSDDEQKLYNGLLQSRIDFGIASQDRARDYSDKLQSIETERSSKLLDAQQSYVGKVADIDRSAASQRLDEDKSYAQKLVDIAKARQQALVDAARQASVEGADALQSAVSQDIEYTAGNEKRLTAHNEKRRLLERQGALCKIPEEDNAYRVSEQQAALAYVNQEKAQQQHLGKMLVDYATAMALQRGIAQQNLDALTNAIRSQYGLQESSSERSFGRMRAVIDEWANAGGQSTDGYIQRLGALREEASQTQQQIERLTKERTNALADRYSRGEIGRDEYLTQLRAIPAQVNKDVGLPNSSEPSQVLAKQKDFDQQAQQASIAHRQRLADIDRSAGQQRADAARQYGASVASINNEWYTKQRADAKDSYDKQEQQAALAYARQQKAQQASLNQQSNDFRKYVDQHLADDARMQIGLDANAQKQLATIQAKRAKGGYDDVTYAGDLAQLVTKSRPANYTTYFPLGVPPGPGGRTSGGVQVVVNNYGPVDSPARVNQIATIAADKVMDRLNRGVDDAILAPPKGPR